MNDVQFERLLSYRPEINAKGGCIEQPTLRDMVFDYYCKLVTNGDEANALTKEYLDEVHRNIIVPMQREAAKNMVVGGGWDGS